MQQREEGRPEICNFGEHLMVDGYGGNEEKLNDKERVLRSLKELPARLDMKPLCEPSVYFAEPNHIKDPGGWSGFVIIAESHISIHTFPKRGFVSIDAYTCRSGMAIQEIVEYFEEAFDLKETEVNFVKRGTRYPAYDIN